MTVVQDPLRLTFGGQGLRLDKKQSKIVRRDHLARLREVVTMNWVDGKNLTCLTAPHNDSSN